MNPIRFMFQASTSRDFAALQAKSGLSSAVDQINEAVFYYKHAVDGERAGRVLVALNTENDATHPIKTAIDSGVQIPTILTITLKDEETQRLNAMFNGRDSADIFTHAFYVYDQILDRRWDDTVIALVDDMDSVTKISILDFRQAKAEAERLQNGFPGRSSPFLP